MRKLTMKMAGLLITGTFLLMSMTTYAQKETNKLALQNFAVEKKAEFEKKKAEALKYAEEKNIPVFIQTEKAYMELMFIDEYGKPQYYITENANSAKTISTNKVNPGGGNGLSLDGAGMTVHEWDGGAIRTTHQELTGRVTQGDGASTTHYHAQHVAGTMIGSGVVASAKGMAPAANLRAFDWNSDESEMATEASNGALVSNHSYGYGRGWSWNGSSWVWYGNTSISTQEDYLFGFYDSQAKDWDQIAYNAPNYLIVKSAGNDRGDGPTSGTYPQDGPYDCISHSGISKNILTVGAVEDIPAGYSQPSDVVMSSFSSWGPCDDSRIKPDIVTNGVGLYSADDDNDSDYQSLSGTSMASPSATGSLLLLQEHHQELKGSGIFMKAATLKALVIATADEAGNNAGPDYSFGWGLMNTLKAAQKITEDQTINVLDELSINNGSSYQRTVKAKGGEPLEITIVWTDKPGTPVSASLDPANAMLVNDLDLRITKDASTYYPWKLSAANPSSAATRSGENNVDNVEMVTIDNPVANADYTIIIDHDGTLDGGSQAFSIIIDGITETATQAPVAEFTASSTTINAGQSVTFSDQSTNAPTSWSWSFTGGTPSSSTQQNPSITYNTPGTYTVTLTASNTIGSDTETKTNYITVSEAPITYCPSQGNNYSYEWISKVEIGNFVKTSAGASYSDFTEETINLSQGASTAVTLTPGFSSSTYTEYWKIWIDYNKDGDFTDAGEEVFAPASSTSAVSGNFTVKADATGTTRMRVTMKYNDSPTPCEAFSYGEVEDYTVTFGAVAAPVAAFTASATTITAGQSVTFTDQSTNSPTSWSWTFDGGTPSSSTSQNPSISYNTAGTYNVSLTATNAGGSDLETKTAYIIVNPAPVNYCSSQGNNYNYEWISQVEVGSFMKSSAGSNYSDYSSDVITLGSSNNVTLTPAFASTTYVEYWRIWIDWNKDGDFVDTGEEVFAPASSSSVVSGSFNVASGFNGQTRMRVSMKWNGVPTSCESFSYGEVEDYTVNYVSGNGYEGQSEEISTLKSEVNVYPNPANDVVYIQTGDISNTEVWVYNLRGKLVTSQKLNDSNGTLDVQHLSKGIYLIRINTNNEIVNEKLIIQ